MANGVDVPMVVLIIVLVNLLSIAIFASRYKRVPPNHAMVVYGRRMVRGPQFRVITGGGKFIAPVVESYALLSLEPFDVDTSLDGVVEDVRAERPRLLRVRILAIARLSDDVEGVRRAATNFLKTPREELRRIVEKTLEGHGRGVIASGSPKTPDEQISDLVRSAAAQDLDKVGIQLVSVSVVRLGERESRDSIVGAIEALKQKIEQIDARLQRLEERSTKARPP
jgi:flotillin